MTVTTDSAKTGLAPVVNSELFNFTAANTRKWRSALARARTGGATAKIALIGDSTTRGMGSNGALMTASQAKSFPKVLADILTQRLLPASSDNFFGTGNVTGGVNTAASVMTADPRLNLGGTWDGTAFFSLGGPLFQATGAGTLAFTPSAARRYYDVYFSAYPGGGSVTTNVGGAGAATTSTSAGTTFLKVTVDAGANSSSALNVIYSSGATIYLAGASGRSATDMIEVMNMGSSGSVVADWVALAGNNAFDPRVSLPTLAPDLTVINLTINDWSAATNTATYTANLQLLINAGLSSGNVILMIGAPSSTAAVSAADQASITACVYALARSNSIPLLDMTYRWSDYTTANGLSQMFDTKHPNAKGYAEIAQALAAPLVSFA